MHRFLTALLPMLVSGACLAQDASLLAGWLKVGGSSERSFGAQLGYSHRLGQQAAVSAEYLNEGHPRDHHRDGLSLQYWLHTEVPQQGASFALGAGPYYYFDTATGAGSALDYRNVHGLGALLSVSAKWHLRRRSYVELRVNRVRARSPEHDTTMLLLGMGYELRNHPPEVTRRNAAAGDNLVMLHAGRAIVNSFKSERATASAVEYRRTVNPNLAWSAMLLSEGKVGLAARKGILAQVWLLRPFTERTVLELGGGPYLMRDRFNRNDAAEQATTQLVPVASIGIRYRFDQRWRGQLTWSRVVTDYHRDSDVILLGVGRAF